VRSLNRSAGARLRSNTNLPGFLVSIWCEKSSLHRIVLQLFNVILEKVKAMIAARKPPVPYNEMLENIAVATAGREAQHTGKTVRLKDVGFDS